MIDASAATVWAAVIAAVSSVLVLLLNFRASKRGEMRAAHRHVLVPILEDLSEDIHEVLAGIVLMRKRVGRAANTAKWQEQAKAAGSRLDRTRRRTRYVLPGLDGAFRELALASDHIATYKDIEGSNVESLLRTYRRLGWWINEAVTQSYRRGVPDPLWAGLIVQLYVARVRFLWNRRPQKNSQTTD